MRKRTVRDVMTQHVHILSPSTPFKAIVRLIEDNRISGLPVVDVAGRVVGIVSEADLLLKEDRESLDRGHWALESRRRRLERQKASGLCANDLMTSPVVTIAGDTPLPQAARLMHDSGVKRLPVVDDEGRIIGIVSRTDLLTVFLRSDREIRSDVEGLVKVTLCLDPAGLEIKVEDGVVRLEGRLPRRTDKELLEALVSHLDGVVGVESRLGYDRDDPHERSRPVWPTGQVAASWK